MGCPDPEAVQGFIDGLLEPPEREVIEKHVDGCDDCRRLFAAFVAAPELAQRVGRYEIVEQIGRGGMGVVYRARDPELRRELALKLLRPDRTRRGALASERLLREAQAMGQIAHPNVISVFDVGLLDGGDVFVAMELVTGGTLREWCKGKSPREIVDAYIEAGRGLAAAHASGIVHRDFKPDNVLLGSDGRVRVTDFGLARSSDAGPEYARAASPVPFQSLTMTGALVGTPGYMAAELYESTTADARSDQFAFCVALWEALYGQRPFRGRTVVELGAAVCSGAIVEPPSDAGVPRSLEHALRRGLSVQRDLRWPTMATLLAELSPRRSRAWLYAAAATLLVAGAVATGWAATRSSPAVAADDAPVAQHAVVLALVERAQIQVRLHDLRSAEATLVEAVAIAERAQLASVKATAIGSLASVLEARGKHDQARQWRALAGAR